MDEFTKQVIENINLDIKAVKEFNETYNKKLTKRKFKLIISKDNKKYICKCNTLVIGIEEETLFFSCIGNNELEVSFSNSVSIVSFVTDDHGIIVWVSDGTIIRIKFNRKWLW